jgi:DnaJ C terminal domain
LRDNLWTRLVAAIRGKFAVALLGKSVLNALPILYFSYKMAICAALYFFFDRLPHLSHHHPRMVGHLGHDHVTFTANLQPGYKANTKLIFNDVQTGHAGVEVHFVLKEAKHAVYTRVGNNLHVACTITPKQAAMGCNVEIPSLSDPDFRLAVAIPRHVSTGDRVVVPDKGWPNRKRKGVKGDLIVTVHVASTLWRRPSRISTV